jgi:transcriptional regulator with XRE-family HTH domain
MRTKGGRVKKPNRLWLARKRRSLGQKQVAFLINKTIDEISRYERGVRLPELPSILALEIIFGAPLRILFKEFYDQVLAEVRQRIESSEALKATYAEFLPASEENGAHEYCPYEDMLRMPNLSLVERGKVRDHVTRIAKKLAFL